MKTILVTLTETHSFFLRLYSFIKRNGLLYVIKFTIQLILNKLNHLSHRDVNNKIFDKLVKKTRMPVIIYPPYHDFNLPLYQRPQHLAHVLAKNHLYLFHSNNTIDGISIIKKLTKNLFILPPAMYAKALDAPFRGKKILFLYSHPSRQWSIDFVDKHLNKDKNIVIYDFLDDLNEEIFGNIDSEVLEHHQYALSEKKIILLVTASKLMDEVKQYRPCLTNTYFIPNAVDINHFQKQPKSIDSLEFLKAKKVIGYFGALASWVDYELIDKLSNLGSEYHILLLGYIYDHKFSTTGLDKRTNVTVLGPIKYNDLPDYAQYFDISIIPFCINETTLATSPIKLFEYMALGKPIISTDLPECRKYKSALIAQNHDEFISLIHKSLKIPKADEYFTIMKKEARANTWESRGKKINQAITQSFEIN